ncbi:MAG: dimethylaniline monooxygenase (N-oxide forming) [Myxococcota bacterium]|jgi:dimethylaniline monooxygenase (N-oxide forming)
MNIDHDTCIIGAGWSGLMACKYFKAAGFNPVVLEKGPDIGGVWRYDPDRVAGGVLASTITTSSISATEMSDFPMPDDFPEFPRHSQIMDYLRAYCERFGLREHIRFSAGVETVEKVGDVWQIHAGGTIYECARVVVCSGVHQEPENSGRVTLAGFEGEVIHSAAIKNRITEQAGKRILLVGTGETASDLAVELTRQTPHLAVSSPRGQWFVGRTSSVPVSPPTLNDFYSAPIRRIVDPTDSAFAATQVIEDRYGACGSGIPEWQSERPFQAQFFNKNTLLIDLWRLGQVTAKPRIVRCEGNTVHFSDGSTGEYDVAILCTGFDTVFPFLPAPYATRRIDAHFKMMLADDETLSFVGFVRPVAGSIPTIAELQSRCLAAMYAGTIPVPGDRQRTIDADKAYAKRRFDSSRIAGLVDMVRYLDDLAIWMDVLPDYGRLLAESPRRWWAAMTAPYNGAQFWLNDDDRREAALSRLKRPKYIVQNALHAWAFILYRNAFPLRRVRAFSERRWHGWRMVVGLLLGPLFLPAGVLVLRKSNALTQVYGALLLLLLSPILVKRVAGQRRRRAKMRLQFLPGKAKKPTVSPVRIAVEAAA